MPVLKQHMRDIQETTCIKMPCGMLGEHQHINAGLVCGALDTLADEGFICADDIQAIKSNAIQAKAFGRLQYVARKQAHIWLDAAHNRHAVEALLPTLPNLANPFDAILVYTREDRSLHDCMALLSPLSKCLISDEVQGEHIYIPTVQAALQYALALHPQAKILLLGSFTSVAAGLRWLSAQNM
jgi:dihydrofolate synthase/folylpolyglutamate synthase